MSFSGDIRRFNEKVEKAASAVFRGTALNLFARVIKRTPVRTGRLRANWISHINSAPDGTTTATDRSGGKAIQAANSTTARAKLGDSIYLVNNLPYAQVIEHGRKKAKHRKGMEGSDQAPQGMVKVTVAEFKQAVAEEAKKV